MPIIALVLLFFLPLTGAYAAGIKVTLDTADGSSAFMFHDSVNSPIAWIDSAGNTVITGGIRLDSGGTETTLAETIIVDGKIGIGVTIPEEKLAINGALTIGSATGTTNGTIRWTGTDFEGRKGGSWISFTATGSVTSVATNNGITGGPLTTSGTIGLTGQALALHNLGTNGLITRTGADTVAARTISAGTGVSVSNGDGVTGNPSISLANTAVSAGSYGTASSVGSFTVDAQGRFTAASNTAIAISAGQVTSGTFSLSRGGTGVSAFAAGGVLYASAAETFTRIAPGAANQVLRSTGANALTIGSLIAADIPALDISTKTSGALAISRGGTGASSVTARTVLIGPAADGAPAWRALEAADLPAFDHSSLGGLGDDDHTQYLRADGTRALSGNWNIGDGRTIQADQVRARDGDGLALYEDGGSGIFVEDGGQVGIGTTTPNEALEVEGNLSLREQGSAPGNTANYGKFYVKSSDSNPHFMTDSGVEKLLAVPDYIKVIDQKASGTVGGSTSAGTWYTRTLNTEVFDTGNHASLASNRVTLAAGTYEYLISAPTLGTRRHMIRLRNITDGTTIAYGTSAYSQSIDYAVTRSFMSGRFTIGASKAFEVQHRCQVSNNTWDLGVENNFGVSNTYTVAEFWKVN